MTGLCYDVVMAAVTISAAMLGGGMVSLPYAVVVLSVPVGVTAILLAGAMTWFTGYLLAELFMCSPSLNDFRESGFVELELDIIGDGSDDDGSTGAAGAASADLPPFVTIARESVGEWGVRTVYWSQTVTLVGVNVVFLILSGINMNILSPAAGVSVSEGIVLASFLSLVMSLSMGDRKHYAWMLWLAVLAALGGIVLRWTSVVPQAPSDVPSDGNGGGIDRSWTEILQSIGAIAFSFGGHAGFPSYQRDMQVSGRPYFCVAITMAYAYTMLLELPFCATVAALRGDDLTPSFVDTLPENSSVSFAILVLSTASMLSAISALVPPVAHNLTHWLDTDRLVNPAAAPFTVQLFACSLAVLFQTRFFHIMSLLGTSSVTLCTFVLPAVFYLRNERLRDAGWATTVGCWACIAIGAFVGTLSTTFSLCSLFM
jgi:amino acid permease